MKKLLCGLALSLALFPVYAKTFAKATIGAPVITLEDLDPSDAVTPVFVAGGFRFAEFNDFLRPAAQGPEVIGNAEVGGTATGDSIWGQTNGVSALFINVSNVYATSFTFTVTPQTRVTLQADFALESMIEGEILTDIDGPRTLGNVELTLAAVSDHPSPHGPPYTVLPVVTDSFLLQSSFNPVIAHRERANGVLKVSFDNASNSDAVFAFRGELVVLGLSGDEPAQSVPEPSTVALSLFGLGLIGAAMRHRPRANSTRFNTRDC